MSPTLFIGIPCYEERNALHQTLEHIRRNTVTPHVLHWHVAKQSVVANKNALLPLARDSGAKYICLCDDDVEPLPGWDTTLIAGIEEVHARTKHRVGQTSPLIVYPDGTVFCAWVNVWFNPQTGNVVTDPVGSAEPDATAFRARFAAGNLPGTLTMFTRTCLDQLGWRFDDRYEKSQHEDLDQGFSGRDVGRICLYNGFARVIHHTQMVAPRASEENYRRLVEKWRDRPDLSRVVEPTEAAVRAAEQQLFAPQIGLLGRARSALRLATDSPGRRARTAIAVLRKTGIRGLLAHLRNRTGGAIQTTPAKIPDEKDKRDHE